MIGFHRRLLRRVRAGSTDLYWRCIGKWFGNPPVPRAAASFLFICQGNVCRSPFAEGYLRKVAERRRLVEVRSRSAGIDVRVSNPSPDLAVRVAKTLEVDLTRHRSKPVTAGMVEDSDVVFAMEHRQAVRLRKAFPRHGAKIFLLPLFDAGSSRSGERFLRYNIPDPYGKAEKEFLECFRKVESAIDGFLSQTELGKAP